MTQPTAGEEDPPTTRGFFGGAISAVQLSRDGRTIYFLDGNGLY